MAKKAEFKKIGPEEAMEMLIKNEGNRKISKLVVRRYADDMRNGRWTGVSNPINITPSGNLANGQHRLEAIIESETTQEFLVVTEDKEVDELGIEGYDTGRPRTINTIMAMKGYAHVTTLSGTARLALMYERCPNEKWSNPKLSTKAEMLEFTASNYPEMLVAARLSDSLSQQLRAGKTWSSAVFFLIVKNSKVYEANPQKLEDFVELLSEGVGLTKDSPVYTLRQYLIRHRAPAAGIWSQQLYVYIALQTWNAWVAGDTYKKVAHPRNWNMPKPL